VSKQQLVLTEVSLLHVASFTPHFDPETTSLFQAVKYQIFFFTEKSGSDLERKSGYSYALYASYPLVECRYSNFVPKAYFHQSFPYPCT
jgi:hypothetical protein